MARTYAAELATVVEALSNLTKQADADRAERREYEKEAREGRQAIELQLHELRAAQQHSADRLERVEPVVTMVTSLHAKVTGGIVVLGLIGAVAWGAIGFFGDAIKRAIFGD